MEVKLTQITPNIIQFLADCGSTCYDSDPKSPLGLVKHVYRSGHHSVLEHAYFTFEISGISRALSHQLVRHRHSSFSQRSQRYCSEDGFGYVNPPNVDLDNIMDYLEACYTTLQEAGVPNEDARYVLPNACETQLVMSCNLSQLIHIANVRLCNRAQWEIRSLVRKMCDLVIEKEPALKMMLVPECEALAPYCFCKEAKSCGRHKTLSEIFEMAHNYENLCK